MHPGKLVVTCTEGKLNFVQILNLTFNTKEKSK